MFLSVTITVTTVVVVIREERVNLQLFPGKPETAPSRLNQSHNPEIIFTLNAGTRCGPIKGLTPHQKPIQAQCVSQLVLPAL